MKQITKITKKQKTTLLRTKSLHEKTHLKDDLDIVYVCIYQKLAVISRKSN